MISRKWGGTEKKAAACREFGPINYRIRITWKNRTETVGAFKQNGSRIK
jgi:hypothetical protein